MISTTQTSSGQSKFPVGLKLGSNCIISKNVNIKGDVTIGNGTIIHPWASIIAEAGPIIIGEHNLIEEKALIINCGDSSSESIPVIIGNYNVFEVESKCEALKVGDNNILESKSFVGKKVVISNNCIIGGGCFVANRRILPDNTALFGPHCTERTSQNVQPQLLQMEFLSKVLPNYHVLLKKREQSSNKEGVV